MILKIPSQFRLSRRGLNRVYKKMGSQRRRGQMNGNVTGLSRTCRGRHEEVGIMEFGLNLANAGKDSLYADHDAFSIINKKVQQS